MKRLSLLSLALMTLLLAACREEPEVETYRLVYPSGTGEPAPDVVDLPPGHPPIKTPEPADDAGADAEQRMLPFEWTPPPSWKVEPIGNMSMRIGSFTVPAVSGTQEADCSIVLLGGAAGGMIANVNRWHRQIGLPIVEEAEIRKNLEPITTNSGLAATVVTLAADLDGRDGNVIRAAIIPVTDGTLFVKLTGPAATVDAAGADFLALVRSIRKK